MSRPPGYSDADAAALYDVLNAWGPSDDFYLELAMAAGSVLDVGCGTGAFLRRVRSDGHPGRLCGVDPDPAALDVARQYPGIEWVAGTAASMSWAGSFELAVMMSHAFQTLIDDAELHASLLGIRRALGGDGRFAFETRNPLVRAWEGWTPEHATEVVDPAGRAVRVSHQVESVVGGVVTMTETTSDRAGRVLRVDRAGLRFLDAEQIAVALTAAGFAIEAQYGDWSRRPFEPAMPEIVTIARAAR